MCNACGFHCCGSDVFEACGCDHCANPKCWGECELCGESGCAGECDDGGGWHHPDDDDDAGVLPSARPGAGASAAPRGAGPSDSEERPA